MVYDKRKLVEPVRLPQQIARLLSDSIRDGTLQPGSGLPSEKQISTDFSVSRSVVREAISILKYDGLVETKQGSGVFVADNPLAGTFRIEGEFEPGNAADLRQLFQLRLYVESAAAKLAARQRSSEELEIMRDAIGEIAHSISSGQSSSEASVEADMRFHNAVSQASKNVYLWSFVNFINAKLKRSVQAGRKNSERKPGLANLVLQEHVAVLEAIELRDEEAAKVAMERHISNSAQRLKLSI